MAKILLIDDRPEVLELIKAVLESTGITVDTLQATRANLGTPELLDQLIAHIQQNKYDLVITDNNFGTAITGLQVAERLIQGGIPTIFITADVRIPKFREDVKKIGLNPDEDLISKPFDPSLL
ncbi:response regulator, partial [Candidatus Micrarchaeota archaeon]|nr:response regulator [Candidatus Micrarchaeota archaeon]